MKLNESNEEVDNKVPADSINIKNHCSFPNCSFLNCCDIDAYQLVDIAGNVKYKLKWGTLGQEWYNHTDELFPF